MHSQVFSEAKTMSLFSKTCLNNKSEYNQLRVQSEYTWKT